MSYKEGLICIVLLFSFSLSFSATAQDKDSYLGGLDWMQISSPEHTAEYLAKSGGGQGDPNAVAGVNLAGNWSFDLSDRISRRMDLVLFQSGTIVFGQGSMRAEAGIQPVTAEGVLAEGGGLYLNAVTLGETLESINLYRMSLNGNALSLSGSYNGFSAAGGPYWSGTASCKKEEARTIS